MMAEKCTTSQVIAELQQCVTEHGDMPFVLRDNEYGAGYSNIAVFVDTIENGGSMKRDTPVIGIAFADKWEVVSGDDERAEANASPMMTSQVITELQQCVAEHDDMPFVLRDNEFGSGYSDISVFVDTVENGGCLEGDTPVIGIAFSDEWESASAGTQT